MDSTHHDFVFHQFAAAAPGYGMPSERLARVAARRAFVELKVSFMRAAAEIRGPEGALLQRKVRLAAEVIDLWRLRTAIFEGLPPNEPRGAMHRHELSRQLDSAFPEAGEESGADTGFAPL